MEPLLLATVYSGNIRIYLLHCMLFSFFFDCIRYPVLLDKQRDRFADEAKTSSLCTLLQKL